MKYVKVLLDIVQKLKDMLTVRQRKIGVVVILVIIVGSFVEVLGVSAILPFIEAILSPEEMMNTWYAQLIARVFRVSESNTVTVIIGIGIILIYFLKNLYLYLSVMFQAFYRVKIQRYLSTKFLKSYMQRPYEYYIQTNTAEALQRIGADVSGVYNLMDGMFRFMAEFSTAVFMSCFIMNTDMVMAVSMIAIAGGCFVVLVIAMKSKTKSYSEQNYSANVMRSKCALQAIMGFKEIKVTQTTGFFIEAYDASYARQEKIGLKKEALSNIPERLIETLCIAALLGIICMKIALGEDMTTYIPKLSVFALAAFRLLPSVSRMTRYMNGIIYDKVYLQRAHKNMTGIISYEESFPSAPAENKERGEEERLDFRQQLLVKEITWNYQGNTENVLQELTLEIKKGESVGLIGVSGAGKTTLADIILGLLKPRQGSVYVDGKDIYAHPGAWSKIINYVPQNIFLSDDSIRSNVAFGCPPEEIDDDVVWAALRKAQMESVVRALPKGLDTRVGERGIRFSGGQRQRIAIARALYRDPDIIVLDEATSALDNETETAVMESIEALQRHKTLIIVAHRLTTIRNCDRIYEIVDGKAVERKWEEIMTS